MLWTKGYCERIESNIPAHCFRSFFLIRLIPSCLETFRSLSRNPSEIVLVIVLTISIGAFGAITIYYQCRNLLSTFRGPDRKEDDVLSPDDVRVVGTHIRGSHRQSKEAAKYEVETMRDFQREVKGKLAGLQQLVAHLSEQQSQEQPQEVASNVQGKERLKDD
jgi:hypothetical protein